MITRLSHVTILVANQDEALRWYTEVLGFEKRADESFGPGARWLTVAPPGQQDLEVVLQAPHPGLHGDAAELLERRVGQGTTWVLQTGDCERAYEKLSAAGVRFTEPPSAVPWGVQAVFTDLYGNPFALVQPVPVAARVTDERRRESV